MAKTQNSKSLIYWSRVANGGAVSSSIPWPVVTQEQSAIQFHGQSTLQSSTAQKTSSDRTASSIPSECTAHSLQERNGLANDGPFAAHATSRNGSCRSQTADSSEARQGECNVDCRGQNPDALDGLRPQSSRYSSAPEAVDGFRQRQFSQHSSTTWTSTSSITKPIFDASQKSSTWTSTSSSTRPIVVVMGWMQSTQRQLAAYLRVINECGWDALACHPPLLHLWIPWRAEALARAVLAELEKELAGRPRPVVFMSFSGGYKACQWKIMEALLSTSAPEAMHRDANAAGAAAEAVAPVPSSSAASPQSALASEREGKVSTSYQHFLSLLRECYAGQVFDSSPVDFTSDLGVRFLSQPPPVTAQPQATFQASATSQQPSTSQPPLTPQCTGSAPASAVATALAAATTPATPAPDAPATSAATAAQQPRTVRHTLVRSAAVVLDWLLLPEFERQRAAQWATLLHCSALAPVLLLCSTDDQLAPIEFIRQYEREAVARGAAVTRVEWRTSEHVGHMRHHRHEYITALRSFLGNALSLWEQQREQQQRGSMGGCRAELAREITSRL